MKYQIRDNDWLTFPLIIVNFNHFFTQPTPEEMFTFTRFSISSIPRITSTIMTSYSIGTGRIVMTRRSIGAFVDI